MRQSQGFEIGGSEVVYKLTRSLYGLKQTPRSWFNTLRAALYTLGFSSTKSDVSLFFKHTSEATMFLLVYVDDIIVTGTSKEAIAKLVQQLHSKFSLRDMGELKYFLGIEVTQTSCGGLLLSQTKYINDLLKKANMGDSKAAATPMTSNLKLTSTDGVPFEHVSLYRSVVGSLQYLTVTRPEIAFCINKVCQFMQAPLDKHWKAVKRILRYLQGTRTMGLHLRKPTELILTGYTDSDWASDIEDHKSTAGYCVMFGPNPVSWCSKKQAAVSRSSTEAEYRGIANVVAELLWIRNLLGEIHILVPTLKVYCDNAGAVLMSANPVLHSRSKHFEIDLHLVRDHVAKGRVQIHHIPGDTQIADVMTKAVSSSRFATFRSKLKIEQPQSLSLRGDDRIIE
ncbi:uncharacterized protein LOC107611630 [Arachis ipaensis]|uniref:uncharacterized protein LOC107611630 n=1 Tax=Arachis ipaensis TaxID=130454 RepID=UPI0007AFC147|nr:uncharacterized protein LOC107611630 [Arachis ipaensis]